MTREEFEQLNIKNGKWVAIKYSSNPKPLKEFKNHTITKVTEGVYRLGIAYCNLKSKIGVKTENLPYGHWESEFKNLLLSHDGNDYLRIYTTNNPKHKSHTTYYLDGEEITKEELIEMGAMSESQSKSKHTELFNVKLENVIQIGKAV